MSGMGDLDLYYFGNAVHYDLYNKMGAHKCEMDGKTGYLFSVWAPHACEVGVVGDFNHWDENSHRMKRVGDGEIGVWELFIPELEDGGLYKFLIYTKDGRRLYKADPFAMYSELRPGNASKLWPDEPYNWTDQKWLDKRGEKEEFWEQPLSIYEVHPGSWMRHPTEENSGFYSYKEFAHSLADYVNEMGYTHVELMGICEYPFDGSWGYQVTGYFAPTSRYGTPADFMYLIDYLHSKNIGVILDWVPAHFPRDEHGLADFDGEPLYEYTDPKKGEHPDWGTKIFDYGKYEVKNFLIASALMWVEKFHVDGLRVDAVASMLYLDYGKDDGQWIANEYGGNENLEAIEFFRHINTLIRGRNKGALMIAEESTAWPKITGDVEDDGLNFSYKWNMGWMHDFTDYMKLDPYFRKGAHNNMTFAMSYNDAERYILVLSHDEVVHLKCSMLNKMPGLGIDKYKNLMAGYAFMMAHPGKKLLFMGQEFGQAQEWSEERELDWYLLDNPDHKRVQDFVKKLLHIYKENPAMYINDVSSWAGFEWINANDDYRSIYSFVRKSQDGKGYILVAINFTPMDYPDYCVGTISDHKHELILSSREFYEWGQDTQRVYEPIEEECDSQKYRIEYPLEPYGVAMFKFDMPKEKKTAVSKKASDSTSKESTSSRESKVTNKASTSAARKSRQMREAKKRSRRKYGR